MSEPEFSLKFPVVKRVDARGLRCPLPLLRAKQQLNGCAPGECIEVWATDAGSERDIPAWIALSGQELLHREAGAGLFRFVICRRR